MFPSSYAVQNIQFFMSSHHIVPLILGFRLVVIFFSCFQESIERARFEDKKYQSVSDTRMAAWRAELANERAFVVEPAAAAPPAAGELWRGCVIYIMCGTTKQRCAKTLVKKGSVSEQSEHMAILCFTV